MAKLPRYVKHAALLRLALVCSVILAAGLPYGIITAIVARHFPLLSIVMMTIGMYTAWQIPWRGWRGVEAVEQALQV